MKQYGSFARIAMILKFSHDIANGHGQFSEKFQITSKELLIKYDEICILVQFKIVEKCVKIHVHGPLLLCKLAQNQLNMVSSCRTFNSL